MYGFENTICGRNYGLFLVNLKEGRFNSSWYLNFFSFNKSTFCFTYNNNNISTVILYVGHFVYLLENKTFFYGCDYWVYSRSLDLYVTSEELYEAIISRMVLDLFLFQQQIASQYVGFFKSVSLLSIVMIFSIHLSRKCYNGCILKLLKSLLGLSHKYSVNLEGNLSIPMN